MSKAIKTSKIIAISAMVVVVVVSFLIPSIFAATTTAYQYVDFSVAQGGTWDGKNTGHLWYVDTQPTRLNLAITSSSTKTVAASLNRVNYLLPDTKIVGISLTGSNGQWTSSDYYVLNNTHAHYGKAYSASTGGATGRVSIQSAS